jgi:hypothetical protein
MPVPFTEDILKSVLEALLAAGQAHRTHFMRSMLQGWEIIDWDDDRHSYEELTKLFHDEYSKRCEGPSNWPDWNPGMTSEDYESLDHDGGWDEGFAAAIEVVRKLAEGE